MSEKKEKVAEAVVAPQNNAVILKIQREEFISKSGIKGFDYFLSGEARERKFKVKLVPPKKEKIKDIGVYEILDIIFNGNLSCDLRVEHNEIEDPNNKGQMISYNSYIVFSKDEDTGVTYECKVVPDQYSDKVKMDIILQLLGKTAQ